MRRIIVVISLLLSAYCLQAQAVFDLKIIQVCWQAAPEVDSTLYAYWLMSSRDEEPRLISYLNIQGQKVEGVDPGDVIGGSCCCKEGSGSGGSTVSITNNGDGTYTAIVDNDSTIITVRTDSIYTDGPVTIDGTTYPTDTDLQTIIENLAQTINNLSIGGDGAQMLGDTIYQPAHSFELGQLLSQDKNNGAYFIASTSAPDSFPVAMTVTILHPDTFVIDGEGWIYDVPQTYLPGRDYYLQDDGSYGLSPDTNYNIFALRVSSEDATKIYFDVPELIVAGGDGTGSQDRDGIYTGSGLVDPGTIATAPDFKFQLALNELHADLDRGNILLKSDSTVIENSITPQLIFRSSVYRWRLQANLFFRIYNADDFNFPFSIHRSAPNNSFELDDLGNLSFSQYSNARPFYSGRSAGRPTFDGTGQLERTPEFSFNHDTPAAGSLDNTYAIIRLEFSGTYTLPDPTTNAGKLFVLIADENTTGILTRTVAAAGAGTFEGNVNLVLDSAREVYGVVSDGTEYIIMWNKN